MLEKIETVSILQNENQKLRSDLTVFVLNCLQRSLRLLQRGLEEKKLEY